MTDRPTEAFPLTWPNGWERTPVRDRARWSQFRQTDGTALNLLKDELRRLGATDVLISSNLALRKDGMPYANQPRTDDEAIAVYFNRRGRALVMACDRFTRRTDNITAIAKSIEALRGLERWGASDMLERAFTGFAALPAPFDWRSVLGDVATLEEAERAYRRALATTHPDRMGDAYGDLMADLNAAREAAREHFA